MNYPDNFDTPAFPAGKTIAISRLMAIGTSIVFLLIIFTCGLLVWTVRSQRVHPFLIATNNISGEWRLVGHDHGKKTVPAIQTLQEATIGAFIQNWFYISEDASENAALWAQCDRNTACVSDGMEYGSKTCALFCATGEDLFMKFMSDIMPGYQARATDGERWTVNMESISAMPVDKISENGGTWRISLTVQSNISAPMEILGYAKVLRNIKYYPRTMGFYVSDFNAYRIN